MKHHYQTRLFWACALVTTLLVAALSPGSVTQAWNDTTPLGSKAVSIPAPKSPFGIITDNTPTYKWSVIAGADKYQYEVYQGTTNVIRQIVASTACGAAVCSHTNTIILAYTAHKWRVRTNDGGIWSAWSVYKSFTVTKPPVSFNSQFNGSMAGWKSLGTIPWHVSDTAMYTSGDEWDASNVYRASSLAYQGLDYLARMKCTTTEYCENYLAIRMGTTIFPEYNIWGPGYLFGYDSGGEYAIWKVTPSGAWVPIVDYTRSTVIKKLAWNTMHVTAISDTFKLYLNGILLETVSDPSYKIGGVGIQMWEYGTTEFQVDWASLTVFP